jgi:hypothetical protein
MSSIDLKSLIIGIFSCALVFMIMGVSKGSNQKYQKYQMICQSIEGDGACNLLNTQTGISKKLTLQTLEKFKVDGRSRIIRYGEKPDF